MNNLIDCQNKTDEEIVVLTLEDKEYFIHLIKRYEKALLRYVFRLANLSREEAEDLLQEVFIKVYQNLNAFDRKLKFSSWIYRITHNEAISHYRRNKNKTRSAHWDMDNEIVNNIAADFDIDKELDNKYLKKQIENILVRMDFKYSQVLTLKFLENKSYKEISDILQKPEGTVATLISRAKKYFKRELAKQNIKI